MCHQGWRTQTVEQPSQHEQTTAVVTKNLGMATSTTNKNESERATSEASSSEPERVMHCSGKDGSESAPRGQTKENPAELIHAKEVEVQIVSTQEQTKQGSVRTRPSKARTVQMQLPPAQIKESSIVRLLEVTTLNPCWRIPQVELTIPILLQPARTKQGLVLLVQAPTTESPCRHPLEETARSQYGPYLPGILSCHIEKHHVATRAGLSLLHQALTKNDSRVPAPGANNANSSRARWCSNRMKSGCAQSSVDTGKPILT